MKGNTPMLTKRNIFFLSCLLFLVNTSLFAQSTALNGPPSERSDINLFYAKGNNWYKFIFHDDSYLFKSNDEGKTWSRILQGWPAKWWLDFKEVGDTLFLINQGETYYTVDHQNYFLYAQFLYCDRYYSYPNSNTMIRFMEQEDPATPVINNQTYSVMQVSFDIGKTWIDISKGLNTYKYTEYDFSTGWYKTVNRFIAPSTTLLTNSGLLSVTYDPNNSAKKYEFLGVFSPGWVEIKNSNFDNLFKNENPEFIFYDKQTKTAYLSVNNSSQLYSSPDEGITWGKIGDGLPDSVNHSIQLFKKKDTLWAIVRLRSTIDRMPNNLPYTTSNTDLIRLYFSTDKGASFTHVPHNIPKGISINKTYVNPITRKIYIVGNGSVYQQNPHNSQDFIASISFFKDKAMYGDFNTRLVAESNQLYFRPFGRAYETSGGLYKSQDNGKTWKNLTENIPNKGVNDFLVKGDTIIILIPFAHISYDGGNSWTKLNLPAIEFELIRYVGGEYYLIGDYLSERAVYTSADLLNWTFKQKLPIPYTDQYLAINLFEVNNNILISTGSFSSTESNTAYISKDTLKTLNIINKNNSIDMRFSGQDFYQSQGYSLYPQTESCRVSYNNGESWSDTLIVSLKDARGICQTNDGRVFATFKKSLKELNPQNLTVINSFSSGDTELGTYLTYLNGYVITTLRLKHGLLSFQVGQKVNARQMVIGENKIAVYPNPANMYVTIENPENESIHCSLINLAGNEVLKYSGNGRIHLTTAEVPEGFYFIKVETEKGIQYSKILIMH